MKSIIAAVLMTVFALPAMAAEAPIQIGSGPTNAGPMYAKIYVTSLSDNIVIKKIVVNRGNCKDAEATPWRPVRLGFGSRLDRIFVGKDGFSTCNVLEVAVETDQGNWRTNL